MGDHKADSIGGDTSVADNMLVIQVTDDDGEVQELTFSNDDIKGVNMTGAYLMMVFLHELFVPAIGLGHEIRFADGKMMILVANGRTVYPLTVSVDDLEMPIVDMVGTIKGLISLSSGTREVDDDQTAV